MTYSFTFTAAIDPGYAIPPQPRVPGRNGAPDSPIRADFPDGPAGATAYVQAWHIWQMQIADGAMTSAERAERARTLGELFGFGAEVASRMSLAQLRAVAAMTPANRELVTRIVGDLDV
jgi:hypothetical protein